VRLLTNLETAKQKLLQIILIGQPELRELLARNDLRQLAQRITARYHLEPLSRRETAAYIEHRLKVAGALGEVFDESAKKEIFRLSQGVPRLVNVICDRALLGAYSREKRNVNAGLVREAAAEVRGERERSPWLRRAALAAAIIGVVVIAASTWLTLQTAAPPGPVAAEPKETSQPAETAVVAEAVTEEDPTTGEKPAVSEAIVEEPAEPESTLLEELQLAADLTGADYAFATLFETWGLEYRSGARDGCIQAAEAGLACFDQRASWASLAQMDRPAILTLVDDTGSSHEVVLTAIRGQTAEVSIGGVRVSHPVADVAAIWFGDYTLLWRPPTGSVVSLGLGSRGPGVTWLRSSLASIDEKYASANPESDIFDAELDELVRNFQRDHRLDIDGVAGQQTQIIINSQLAVEGTPRLSAPLLALD
jgi:general secretion pathway protein A